MSDLPDHDPIQNPYAPPGAGAESAVLPDRGAAAPGDWVKWVYGALTVANMADLMTLWFSKILGLDRETIQLLLRIEPAMRYGFVILGAVWIYHAWHGVPATSRGDVSPAGAVGRLLIPIYSMAWVFLVNTKLCDILDSWLAAARDQRRAPKSVAMLAAALYLVPILMTFFASNDYAFVVNTADHALWLVYMFQCDPLRRAVAAMRA